MSVNSLNVDYELISSFVKIHRVIELRLCVASSLWGLAWLQLVCTICGIHGFC